MNCWILGYIVFVSTCFRPVYCKLKPMALESNGSWIATKGNEQQLFVSETVHTQQRPQVKVVNKEQTQTER